MERKISTCVNVRVNVGNYQHIEIAKYAEETVQFSSESERLEKEAKLTSDIIQDLHKTMKQVASDLGKGTAEAAQVTEAIKKVIPEWIANSSVPNIANGGKKLEIKVNAEQKEIKDVPKTMIEQEKPKITTESVVKNKTLKEDIEVNKKEPVIAKKDDLFDDLFN